MRRLLALFLAIVFSLSTVTMVVADFTTFDYEGQIQVEASSEVNLVSDEQTSAGIEIRPFSGPHPQEAEIIAAVQAANPTIALIARETPMIRFIADIINRDTSLTGVEPANVAFNGTVSTVGSSVVTPRSGANQEVTITIGTYDEIIIPVPAFNASNQITTSGTVANSGSSTLTVINPFNFTTLSNQTGAAYLAARLANLENPAQPTASLAMEVAFVDGVIDSFTMINSAHGAAWDADHTCTQANRYGPAVTQLTTLLAAWDNRDIPLARPTVADTASLSTRTIDNLVDMINAANALAYNGGGTGTTPPSFDPPAGLNGEWTVAGTLDAAARSVTVGTTRTYTVLGNNGNLRAVADYVDARQANQTHVVMTYTFNEDGTLASWATVRTGHGADGAATCSRWDDSNSDNVPPFLNRLIAEGVVFPVAITPDDAARVTPRYTLEGTDPPISTVTRGTVSKNAVLFALNHAANAVFNPPTGGGGGGTGVGPGNPDYVPGPGLPGGNEPGYVAAPPTTTPPAATTPGAAADRPVVEVEAVVEAGDNPEGTVIEIVGTTLTEEEIAQGLVTAFEVTVTVDEEAVEVVAAPFAISVAIDVDAAQNANRFVAVHADGTVVAGTFDAATGAFTFETTLTGEFVIIYADAYITRVSFQIGSTNVEDLAGTVAMPTDVFIAPQIINDRTYVPLRFLSYVLGAEIGFTPASGDTPLTVHVTLNPTLDIPIGVITPELAALGMDTPAMIVEDRTIVPIAFVAEFFGADVQWDAAAQSVGITLIQPEAPVLVALQERYEAISAAPVAQDAPAATTPPAGGTTPAPAVPEEEDAIVEEEDAPADEPPADDDGGSDDDGGGPALADCGNCPAEICGVTCDGGCGC